MDDTKPKQIGWQHFIKTSHGYTYFEQDGQGAETVVLVPGLAIPTRITFAKQKELARHYRVLTFDLYGRGYSDRPRVAYDPSVFAQQLTDVLNALEIREPFHLVGVSMGGAISTWYANRHAEQIKSLTLMAPAGLPMKLPFTSQLVKMPLLGDCLMQSMGPKNLLKNFRKGFVAEPSPELTAIFLEQFADKAYLEAILATLRNFPLNAMEAEYEAWALKQKPTLIAWGTEDQIVPFALNSRLRQLIPHAQAVNITGAGHAFTYEHAEEVNATLRKFLG